VDAQGSGPDSEPDGAENERQQWFEGQAHQAFIAHHAALLPFGSAYPDPGKDLAET